LALKVTVIVAPASKAVVLVDWPAATMDTIVRAAGRVQKIP